MNLFSRTFMAMAVLALAAGCNKDDNDGPAGGGGGGGGGGNPPGTITVQYTINGDGYNNQVVSWADPDAVSVYINANGANTTVGTAFMGENNDEYSFSVFFPGNTTGSWNCGGDEDDCNSQRNLSLGLDGKMYIATELTVNTISYGPVGGVVQGNFNATVLDPIGGGTADVTGSFSLVRDPDVG